jgi:hypothetical protein
VFLCAQSCCEDVALVARGVFIVRLGSHYRRDVFGGDLAMELGS